jgi:hypothetical protein
MTTREKTALLSSVDKGPSRPLGERLFEAGPSLFGEVEGLGIVDARHAAESQGGSLILEETRSGVCIGVSLPRSEGPR